MQVTSRHEQKINMELSNIKLSIATLATMALTDIQREEYEWGAEISTEQKKKIIDSYKNEIKETVDNYIRHIFTDKETIKHFQVRYDEKHQQTGEARWQIAMDAEAVNNDHIKTPAIEVPIYGAIEVFRRNPNPTLWWRFMSEDIKSREVEDKKNWESPIRDFIEKEDNCWLYTDATKVHFCIENEIPIEYLEYLIMHFRLKK